MNYVIRFSRTFFRNPTRHLLHGEERAYRYATKAEAMAEIEKLDAQIYYQADGEYGRPEYKVVHISKVPQFLAGYL